MRQDKKKSFRIWFFLSLAVALLSVLGILLWLFVVRSAPVQPWIKHGLFALFLFLTPVFSPLSRRAVRCPHCGSPLPCKTFLGPAAMVCPSCHEVIHEDV